MSRTVSLQLACAAVALVALVPTANAQSTSDDRLALMASGSTLTDTNGGWGASALWLHYFNANTIAGLGGEHQSIGDARWNFGKLTFNHGFGDPQRRTNVYFEAAEGSGHDAVHDYGYSIETLGVFQNISPKLILQLEDKQIDVDTAKGNLPKVGVQYLWTPRLGTSVGYAYSLSDALETRLFTARVDGYLGSTVTAFAGMANGPSAAIFINSIPAGPGAILHEYYAGIARAFSRADTTLVLDYSRLGESTHWTLSFNATLHKRTGAAR